MGGVRGDGRLNRPASRWRRRAWLFLKRAPFLPPACRGRRRPCLSGCRRSSMLIGWGAGEEGTLVKRVHLRLALACTFLPALHLHLRVRRQASIACRGREDKYPYQTRDTSDKPTLDACSRWLCQHQAAFDRFGKTTFRLARLGAKNEVHHTFPPVHLF